MKNKLKRVLSLILTFAMVISYVPTPAYATEIVGDVIVKESTTEHEHIYAEGVCSVCGEEEPTGEPEVAPVADEGEEQVDETPVSAPALPTATVTKIANKDLTFALNFKADEVEDAQLAYYGNWFADFELTFNKDVTLNANGDADGYLSGQYDEWSENWVNVPFENVTLTANETFKIMEYASKLMGENGLKLTYNDVYTSVKDFDCGVYLTPAFLAANPDLEVTLELRMYNPANESESYVIGETYTYTAENISTELPTATVTKIANKDLTFALNFKADEVSEGQLAYYSNWYADFELTVNKAVTFNANGGANGYLAGQYDAWSENWVNVPFEDVTLNAGETLKIMEYASKLMGKEGLKYTYGEVCEVVKNFNCGVYLTPEFLAANPDLEVTLELRMYNPADENESYTIGRTYEYTVEDIKAELPTATVTKIANKDLTFALNFKADEVSEGQLAYYSNWYADFELTVNKAVTFNANGGANGYLAGQYDAWSENWVNVPFEDVTLNAGETLKIMEYASKLMGKEGLKYTYGEVCEVVKNFNCGVFFEPAFLAANPDLEVTLELRMYNPADEKESYTIGETYEFTAPAVSVPEADKVVENIVDSIVDTIVGEGATDDEKAEVKEDLKEIVKEAVKEVINELQTNEAVNEHKPEIKADGATAENSRLVIDLVDIGVKVEAEEETTATVITSITYDVKPFVNDKEVNKLDEPATFLLAVPAGINATEAEVFHDGESMGMYEIKGTDPERYVEISSAEFSPYEVRFAVTPSVTYVAEVNGVKYETLQAAIDAAQKGQTVTVLADIVLAEGVTVAAGKTVTIDLNGKVISRNTELQMSTAAITNDGTLTIQDSVGGGKVTAFAANPDTAEIPYYASNTIFNYGTLTIAGGTIENSTSDDARAAFPIDNSSAKRDATLYITGGTVTGRGAIRQFATSTTFANNVYITGGTVTGSSYGIWMQNNGSADNKAVLEISGGNIGKVLISPSANFSPSITSGTVKEVAIWNADTTNPSRNPSGFITGGTFSSDVSAFCADGFKAEANGDGTFGVVEAVTYVAEVNGVKYATLSEAFAAVTDDSMKVVILEDCAETLSGVYLRGNITSDKKVTITLLNDSDWTYMPYTFVLGENITLNVPAMFYYAGGTVINGTLVVGAYYQRYAGTKLTINEPGSLTVTGEQFIVRYMNGDPDAGIYIVGDNNDETVGLKADVIYFYQGMLNAKDADLEFRTYRQTQGTDGQGSANLVLDNSNLKVTVNDHAFEAKGNSTVTLKNGSTITVPNKFATTADTKVVLDTESTINTKGVIGGGEITVNAKNLSTEATVISGDMTGFEGKINVIENDYAKYEATTAGLKVVKKGLDGEGTQENPFLIKTLEDLILFRNSVNAGETKYNAPGVVVALAADIDLADTAAWTEGIGDGTNTTFDGIFDGKNFTIKNLVINPTADADKYLCGGLFGYIYGAAEIKNLVIENVTITTTEEGHNVGALVGFANNKDGKAHISNITVKGNVNINAPKVYGVGVIVGYSYRNMGTIEDCTVDANDGSSIIGQRYVGGITGYSYANAIIDNCSVENIAITATDKDAGGIAGLAQSNNTITNCTVAENVTVTATANVGYVVGAISEDGMTLNIESCTAADPMVGGNWGDAKAVVAKVGNRYYTTFAAAYAAANEGETITLLAPVVVNADETLTLNKDVTIAYTSNVPGEDMFTVRGTMNVNAGKITYENTDSTAVNVTVSTISCEPGAVLNITGGVVENTSTKNGAEIYPYVIDMLTNGNLGTVTATISGGKVYSEHYMAIRQFNNSTTDANTLTIEGGEIYGAKRAVQTHIANNTAYTTISGGTIKGGEYALCLFSSSENLTVSGGTFTGSVYSAVTGFITGGTFSEKPYSGYCAEGFKAVENENGTFGVVEANYVAQVGDVKYESLEAALAAAQAGDTVTLLADVTVGELDVAKSITIDGSGYSIKPENPQTTYNSAIMAGNSGWGDDHGETIILKNIKFNGWKTNYGVVRAQGVTLAVEGCTFENCNASHYAYGVLSCNYTDATVANCTFTGNTSKVIDVNYNADGSNSVVNVENCTFTGNTSTGAGIVFRNAGVLNVKDCVFTGNTVNTNGNAATIYVGFGAGNSVTGCTFENNTVVTSHTTTKRFASAIFCDGCTVNGNAFGTGNTATRNGEAISTIVAVGAYYGAADISGNYWGGEAPVAGVDYTIEYTRNEVALESYYKVYENSELKELVKFVAEVNGVGYETLEAALAAAQAGDTVTLLADITLTEVVELNNVDINIAGDYTLTLDDNLKVCGESTINISAKLSGEVWFENGATIKNSTINGDVFAAGNVVFKGANTVNMIYDFGVLTSNYGTSANMKWTVAEGGSLNVLAEARYGLGYGDDVTIIGSIENALTVRDNLTEADRSLFMHGLVAQESKGWNKNSKFTVKDAYVVIGDNNSFGNKSGNYGGTYTFDFENAVVDGSRITFYEALSTTTFNLKNSDVKIGTFMTRDTDSVFNLVNTKLISTTTTNGNDEGNYHAGTLNLTGSELTYNAPVKVENGTINLDVNSAITAPSISGTGTIIIDATNFTEDVTVITADMSAFTGTIEVINNSDVIRKVEDGKVIVAAKPVAEVNGVGYPTLQAAVDAAQSDDTVTLLADINTTSSINVTEGKSIVLDLNGYEISCEGENADAISVTGGSELTVEDSGETGKITAVGLNCGAIYAKNSTVTINGGTLEGKNNTECCAIYASTGSTVTINGGKLIASGENIDYSYGIVASGDVVFNGGEIISNGVGISGNGSYEANITITGGTITAGDVGIYFPQNKDLTITGGTITGTTAVYFKSGNLAITGGKLVGNGKKVDYGFVDSGSESTGEALVIENVGSSDYEAIGTVSITGGTFTSVNANAVGSYKANSDAEVITGFISGGTFSSDVSALCAVGLKAVKNSDGMFGIVENVLEGSGTEADPYIIETVEDLILFRDSVNAGQTKYNADGVYVALADDIDLAGIDWSVNIGDDCNVTFKGIFDGDDYTISNLNCTETAQKSDGYICTGLFGAIGGNAVIKNLTIKNATINTGNYTGNNVGVVVGFAWAPAGSIENVSVEGNVKIDAPNAYGVGAIVGYNYYSKGLEITDCSVSAKAGSYINASAGAGAIVGYSAGKLEISDCTVRNLDITAKGLVGGLVGVTTEGTLISNTVKNVNLRTTGEYWINSAAVAVGTLASTKVTVSDLTASNVTANGNPTTVVVGSKYTENPTSVVESIEAKIGDVYYAEIAAAITAAYEGETVELLSNTADAITLDKAIVLEIGAYTATVNIADIAATVKGAEGAAVTTSLEGYAVVYSNGVYSVERPVAAIGDVLYTTLDAALSAAVSGDTVRLLADVEEIEVSINKGVTLDLNGYKLTANYVVAFTGNYIVDNSADSTGLLVVNKNNMALLSLNPENAQLPVWNEVDGYHFFKLKQQQQFSGQVTQEQFVYMFRPSQTQFNKYMKNGAADNGISFKVRLSWTDSTGITGSKDFAFSDSLIGSVYENNRALTLTATGFASYLDKDLSVSYVVTSGAVSIESTPMLINPN